MIFQNKNRASAMLKRTQICTDTIEFSDARVVTFLNPYSFLKVWESNVDLKKFDKVCIDGIALKVFLDLVFLTSFSKTPQPTNNTALS